MSGLLSRGNLILGASWVLAVAMFVARGRHVDAGERGGAARTTPAPVRVSQDLTPAVIAPVMPPEVAPSAPAPLEVPVSAELGDAVSRSDHRSPLP